MAFFVNANETETESKMDGVLCESNSSDEEDDFRKWLVSKKRRKTLDMYKKERREMVEKRRAVDEKEHEDEEEGRPDKRRMVFDYELGHWRQCLQGEECDVVLPSDTEESVDDVREEKIDEDVQFLVDNIDQFSDDEGSSSFSEEEKVDEVDQRCASAKESSGMDRGRLSSSARESSNLDVLRSKIDMMNADQRKVYHALIDCKTPSGYKELVLLEGVPGSGKTWLMEVVSMTEKVFSAPVTRRLAHARTIYSVMGLQLISIPARVVKLAAFMAGMGNLDISDMCNIDKTNPLYKCEPVVGGGGLSLPSVIADGRYNKIFDNASAAWMTNYKGEDDEDLKRQAHQISQEVLDLVNRSNDEVRIRPLSGSCMMLRKAYIALSKQPVGMDYIYRTGNSKFKGGVGFVGFDYDFDQMLNKKQRHLWNLCRHADEKDVNMLLFLMAFSLVCPYDVTCAMASFTEVCPSSKYFILAVDECFLMDARTSRLVIDVSEGLCRQHGFLMTTVFIGDSYQLDPVLGEVDEALLKRMRQLVKEYLEPSKVFFPYRRFSPANKYRLQETVRGRNLPIVRKFISVFTNVSSFVKVPSFVDLRETILRKIPFLGDSVTRSYMTASSMFFSLRKEEARVMNSLAFSAFKDAMDVALAQAGTEPRSDQLSWLIDDIDCPLGGKVFIDYQSTGIDCSGLKGKELRLALKVNRLRQLNGVDPMRVVHCKYVEVRIPGDEVDEQMRKTMEKAKENDFVFRRTELIGLDSHGVLKAGGFVTSRTLQQAHVWSNKMSNQPGKSRLSNLIFLQCNSLTAKVVHAAANNIHKAQGQTSKHVGLLPSIHRDEDLFEPYQNKKKNVHRLNWRINTSKAALVACSRASDSLVRVRSEQLLNRVAFDRVFNCERDIFVKRLRRYSVNDIPTHCQAGCILRRLYSRRRLYPDDWCCASGVPSWMDESYVSSADQVDKRAEQERDIFFSRCASPSDLGVLIFLVSTLPNFVIHSFLTEACVNDLEDTDVEEDEEEEEEEEVIVSGDMF